MQPNQPPIPHRNTPSYSVYPSQISIDASTFSYIQILDYITNVKITKNEPNQAIMVSPNSQLQKIFIENEPNMATFYLMQRINVKEIKTCFPVSTQIRSILPNTTFIDLSKDIKKINEKYNLEINAILQRKQKEINDL